MGCASSSKNLNSPTLMYYFMVSLFSFSAFSAFVTKNHVDFILHSEIFNADISLLDVSGLVPVLFSPQLSSAKVKMALANLIISI